MHGSVSVPRRDERGLFLPSRSPLERFTDKCRFEPETGCVIWTGGQTSGRGHNFPYGSFWYEGRRWFAHRWAAKFIHGLDIEGYHVDHCCPHIPRPNTLCVEHLQAKTLLENVAMQHERRKFFIHLQVGLIGVEEVYGPSIEHDMDLPFYEEPAWLKQVV